MENRKWVICYSDSIQGARRMNRLRTLLEEAGFNVSHYGGGGGPIMSCSSALYERNTPWWRKNARDVDIEVSPEINDEQIIAKVMEVTGGPFLS